MSLSFFSPCVPCSSFNPLNWSWQNQVKAAIAVAALVVIVPLAIKVSSAFLFLAVAGLVGYGLYNYFTSQKKDEDAQGFGISSLIPSFGFGGTSE